MNVYLIPSWLVVRRVSSQRRCPVCRTRRNNEPTAGAVGIIMCGCKPLFRFSTVNSKGGWGLGVGRGWGWDEGGWRSTIGGLDSQQRVSSGLSTAHRRRGTPRGVNGTADGSPGIIVSTSAMRVVRYRPGGMPTLPRHVLGPPAPPGADRGIDRSSPLLARLKRLDRLSCAN